MLATGDSSSSRYSSSLTSSDDHGDSDTETEAEANLVKLPGHRTLLLRHAPRYVRLTRDLVWRRGIRVYSLTGMLRIEIPVGSLRKGLPIKRSGAISQPMASYTYNKNSRERAVFLSLQVTSQCAEFMPVDLRVNLFGAPRDYILQADLDTTQMAVECMPNGIVYADRRCNISFCSLDAFNFDVANALSPVVEGKSRDTTIDTLDNTGGVLTSSTPLKVPLGYKYAELLRNVTRARKLESLSPVVRACATADVLHSPLRSSEFWVYDNPQELRDSIAFVDEHLVPAASLDFDNRTFTIDTFDGSAWSTAFAKYTPISELENFEAEIRYVAWIAVIPE